MDMKRVCYKDERNKWHLTCRSCLAHKHLIERKGKWKIAGKGVSFWGEKAMFGMI